MVYYRTTQIVRYDTTAQVVNFFLKSQRSRHVARSKEDKKVNKGNTMKGSVVQSRASLKGEMRLKIECTGPLGGASRVE